MNYEQEKRRTKAHPKNNILLVEKKKILNFYKAYCTVQVYMIQRKQESKNWFTRPNPGDTYQDVTPKADQEKNMLSKTLEAIMGRLTAMEARQHVFYPQNTQAPLASQPLISPVVPQPGTQTQNQWASQNQWTQSQY